MSVCAQEILQSLFNPEDNVCFRVFDDRKEGIFTGQKLMVECGKYKTIEATLIQHNDLNRGIFFVVNSGGHDDTSITRINAQFVECDDLSFEEQQKRIDEFPLPPVTINLRIRHRIQPCLVPFRCLSYNKRVNWSDIHHLGLTTSVERQSAILLLQRSF